MMPVGKVFNAAENQVLFSPVSNYYKGKAIRQQLAAGEQDAELRGLQIDSLKQEIADAPSQREAAKQKALLEAENIRSQIDERYAKGDREALKYADEVMKPLFQAYGDEENEDKALEIFNTGLPEAISRLPEDEQAAFLEAAGPDRVFSHDEIMMAGLARRTVEDKEKELSDYTLGKGRYSGKTNELIAGIAPSEGGDGMDAKGLEIDRYQRVLGLSEDLAVKIAYGQYTIKPNPVSGSVQVIDATGGIVKEVSVERDDVPTPSPEKGKTLWDLATYATGPANTIEAGLSIPLAWIGATPFEKVVDARQTFATTNQDFVRALQNNKRYPIGERNAITEEISMIPTFMDDPKLMRIRINSLRDSLSLRAEQATRDASDPNNPAAFRGGAKQAASDINNYLAILGEPTAPQYALDALAEDPSKIDFFEEYYGYRPEGY
jgi:hypothetical protein